MTPRSTIGGVLDRRIPVAEIKRNKRGKRWCTCPRCTCVVPLPDRGNHGECHHCGERFELRDVAR